MSAVCAASGSTISRNRRSISRARNAARSAYLSHYGEMNQARLADLMEVAPISAGRLLDRMEEGGWIERLPNPDDRRERQVRMTAKAQKALNAARRVGDEIAEEALSGFSAEEHEQLIAMLGRVRANLSRIVDR